jgi:hypothetical protein
MAADPLFAWGGEPDRATLYGPLWSDVSTGLALLTAGVDPLAHVLSYKLLGSVVLLLSLVLLWRLLPIFGSHGAQRPVGLLLFAWNPLVLFELVGNGHNDGFMLVLMLAGVLAVASPRRRLARAPVLGLLLFTLAALVKYMPVIFVVLTAAAWARSLSGWRTRIARLAAAGILLAGVTAVLSAPWFDVQHPTQVLSNAASAGDRYVNAIWDLPTTFIARRWIDRGGQNLAGADESVRVWPRTILRGLFVAYIGFEVVRLWAARGAAQTARAQAIVEAATRLFLVALLGVSNQVLAWYFTWPLATASSLGWRHPLAKLAVGYSVLYLPLFYAIHEDLAGETAPWLLLTYALAPPLWLLLLRSRNVHGAHRSSPAGAPKIYAHQGER